MLAKTSTSIIFMYAQAAKLFLRFFSLFFLRFWLLPAHLAFFIYFFFSILDHWRFALPAFQHVCECDCLHFNEKLTWKYADYETLLVFVLGGALVKFQRYNIHGERRSRFYNSLLGNKVNTSLTEFWNTHNNFLIPLRQSGSL